MSKSSHHTISPFFAGLLVFILSSIAPAEPVRYVVRPGDTLYGIAREQLGDARHWITIAELNGIMPPYTLQAGAQLRLPEARDTTTHSAVSARYGGHEPEMREANPPNNRVSDAAADLVTAPPAPSPNPAASAERVDSPAMANPGRPRTSFVPGHTVTLEALLTELAARNPSIAAAQESARAAEFRPAPAASLPDPTVRVRVIRDQERVGMVDPGMNTVTFRDESMWKEGIEVSQMIPLGKLGPMSDLERKMADRMREMAGMEAAIAVRRLKTLYAELNYVDRTAITLTRIRDLMKLVLASTEALYKVGEGRQSDLLRAQLEISMITDRLIMMEGRRRAAAEELNALLDRPADAPIGTPAPLSTYDPGNANATSSGSFDASPAVRIARAEVESSRARISVSRSMFIPDLELMGGIQNRPNLDPMWEVGIGITLPIWSGSKQTPALRESEANLKAAQERLRAALAGARRGVQTSLAMAHAAHSQSQLYTATIIPQARLTLEASLASYRVGAVDFMTVVSNLASLMEFEIAANESVANFYRAVAMAEESTGRPMEWRVSP